MTRASFRIDTIERKFTTALIYNLQKKSHNSSNQSTEDNTFTENLSTNIQLVVIWRAYNNRFSVRALLIKNSNTITWDEDKLEKLYSMYCTLRGNSRTKNTWRLDDATVLMTASKQEADHTFEITISKRTRKCSSIEPLCIPSNM
jgi:adenylyl- and sulfurtransferase ThiI